MTRQRLNRIVTHWLMPLSHLFLLTCQMYNLGSGKISYRLAYQVSTKEIPRPLKMNEGLSTSKRQAESEKWLVAHIYLPMPLLISTIAIVELALCAIVEHRT